MIKFAAGQTALDETALGTLRCVVGHMIPASEELGVPGADDPVIFADILRSIGRDGPALGKVLRTIDSAADGRLAELPPSRQSELLARLRDADHIAMAVIESLTARCYYRDRRVLTSIGMATRPPFPRGFELKQGDWSLLEPVRKRGRVWRDAK